MSSVFDSARPWKNAQDCDLQRFEAISRVFLGHDYLLAFFFDSEIPRTRLDPEPLLIQAKGFSKGEYLLIKIALDIWSSSGKAMVHELIEDLDRQNFYFTLEAMVISRRGRF